MVRAWGCAHSGAQISFRAGQMVQSVGGQSDRNSCPSEVLNAPAARVAWNSAALIREFQAFESNMFKSSGSRGSLNHAQDLLSQFSPPSLLQPVLCPLWIHTAARTVLATFSSASRTVLAGAAAVAARSQPARCAVMATLARRGLRASPPDAAWAPRRGHRGPPDSGAPCAPRRPHCPARSPAPSQGRGGSAWHRAAAASLGLPPIVLPSHSRDREAVASQAGPAASPRISHLPPKGKPHPRRDLSQPQGFRSCLDFQFAGSLSFLFL